MNSITQDLRKLIIENPELKIIPFVSEDAVCSDYGYTIARVSRAYVDSYIQSPFDDEQILIKKKDYELYEEGFLEATDIDSDYDGNIDDTEIRAAYEALDWKRAILFFVESY